MTELGIYTIGDIAKWPESELIRMFGENGRDLARHSKGIDDRPITTERETKSVSSETTFAQDISNREILRRTIHKLSEDVGHRLRELGLNDDIDFR